MTHQSAFSGLSRDLEREVYCVLGVPIDAVVMSDVIKEIESAAAQKETLWISTPNLNFLTFSQSDEKFRETLLESDLCPADGMPLIWIARLLQIPIKKRTSGSDIFEALKKRPFASDPLRVFLFGGADGIAETAARMLNSQCGDVCCVGFLYPGFGTVEEMSRDAIINQINASGADFLLVSLGAQKGQLWLQKNGRRLLVPVRSHLGTTINFQAGTLRRAPLAMQRWGLEWLWRIKEEPYLWRRYWRDGSVLVRLVVRDIIPLMIINLRSRIRQRRQNLSITQSDEGRRLVVTLSGDAIADNVAQGIRVFDSAIRARKDVMISCLNLRCIDARFLGLILMLRKRLIRNGAKLVIGGLSPGLRKIFHLSGAGFMLSSNTSDE